MQLSQFWELLKMNFKKKMVSAVSVAVAALAVMLLPCRAAANIDQYFTDLGDIPNPAWYNLKQNLVFRAPGSTIQVNHAAIQSPYSNRSVTRPMAVHIPNNQAVLPRSFDQISRWYQESESNTQIFRMFPGEDNVVLSRVNAPRVEAFGLLGWNRGEGWHEFSGRYTFLKVRPGAVFQIKHNATFWSMQLILDENLDGTFDLSYVKLRDKAAKTLLMEDVVGKGVDIKVLDDGDNHKVFVDGALMVENTMSDRPEGETNKARWGIYSSRAAMDRDILILVTGAHVGPEGAGFDSSEEENYIYDFNLVEWNDIGSGKEPDQEFLKNWQNDTESVGYGFF